MCGLPGYFKALCSFQKEAKKKKPTQTCFCHYILSFWFFAFEIPSASDRIINSYCCHHITSYVLGFKPVWYFFSLLKMEVVLCQPWLPSLQNSCAEHDQKTYSLFISCHLERESLELSLPTFLISFYHSVLSHDRLHGWLFQWDFFFSEKNFLLNKQTEIK